MCLCEPFTRRPLHFFGKSFLFLFLFFVILNTELSFPRGHICIALCNQLTVLCVAAIHGAHAPQVEVEGPTPAVQQLRPRSARAGARGSTQVSIYLKPG